MEDGAGVLYPIATHWAYLPPAVETDQCLELVTANEELKEYGQPVFTLKGDVIDLTGSNTISPLRWLNIKDPNMGPARDYVWEQFKFRPCNSDKIAFFDAVELVEGPGGDKFDRVSFNDFIVTQFGTGVSVGDDNVDVSDPGDPGGGNLPPLSLVFNVHNNLGQNLLKHS